jgi:hypothetical protein
MNIAHEINKVLNILQVPISDIKFKGPYAEIYSDGANIGNLPVYSQASIISYDSSEAVLNKLNWSVIYIKYQDNLLTAIAELLSNEDIWITAATFGHAYANDKKDNGNIGLFKCSYDGKKWNVSQIR